MGTLTSDTKDKVSSGPSSLQETPGRAYGVRRVPQRHTRAWRPGLSLESVGAIPSPGLWL